MEQAELLRYVLDVLESQEIPYLLVGSLASGVFGEGRLTHDIDVVIDLRSEQVERLCESFPEPQFYVSVPAVREAVLRNSQFNVIHPESGNKIDFLLARRDAWGREQLARGRQELVLPNRSGYVASPEDVILGKMWYYQVGQHEKHLRDIAAMFQLSGDEIDSDYIEQWADKLGLMPIWQIILARLGKTSN